MSSVVNRDNMEPDMYNNAAYDANKDIWWLALPTELFEAVTPPTGIPSTLRGNSLSPRWDKLILSATPSMAMCTLFFHSTEMHLESANWQHAKLMSLDINTVQQKKRIGQSTVNLFNRGYNMASQLQIEAGQQMCLTTDEMSSIQIWDVETTTTGGNIIQSIVLMLMCRGVQHLPRWNNRRRPTDGRMRSHPTVGETDTQRSTVQGETATSLDSTS